VTTPITAAEAARLLDELTVIVVQAIEAVQNVPAFNVPHRMKADHSPVTAADEASEAALLNGLKRLIPNVPVLSEEAFSRDGCGALGRSFVLADPLDGTREFLAGLDEYAINLAIVTDGMPVGGIVAAPARGLIWRGANGKAERLRHFGRGAVGEHEEIRTRRWPARDAVATISRSHLDGVTDAYLAHMPITREACGSAIKFCKLAEGTADIYPRFGPTSEWDIAAGHAVLVAAGGLVTGPARMPLAYGNAGNNYVVPAFIAWGDPEKAAEKSL
jgi:3'(2'), 5'-bisphosphate nucleotidase